MCTAGQRVSLTNTGPGPSFSPLQPLFPSYIAFLHLSPVSPLQLSFLPVFRSTLFPPKFPRGDLMASLVGGDFLSRCPILRNPGDAFSPLSLQFLSLSFRFFFFCDFLLLFFFPYGCLPFSAFVLFCLFFFY